jgi:signal transduction histidine kinase
MANTPFSIIIADDNPDDRELIKRSLVGASLPCRFREVNTVDSALKACRDAPADCMFLDYSFPGEDSIKGLALLRERFPHMPVIMATGQGDEMIAAKAVMAGAADYIPKSRISRTSLRRIVAEQQEALANFNRVLAHDLKAPLSSITGFAQLLRHGLAKGDTKGSAAFCARIENAARRMCTLIDTLRAYTRAEAQAAFEPVNMALAFEDAVANLSQTIQERGAEVIAANLPMVTGSAPLLINLLQNLIANSIKFCEANTPTVHVSAAQHENGWLFAVKDNGIGIPDKARETVFDPFTRLHACENYEGTGLGLATCKRVIEHHRGAIWCTSAEGAGTTIYFTLPSAEDKAA